MVKLIKSDFNGQQFNDSDDLLMLSMALFEEVCYQSKSPVDSYEELQAAISEGIPTDRMIEIEKEKAEYPRSEAQEEADKIAKSISVKDDRKIKLLAKEIVQFIGISADSIKYRIGGLDVSRERLIAHLMVEYDFLCAGMVSPFDETKMLGIEGGAA